MVIDRGAPRRISNRRGGERRERDLGAPEGVERRQHNRRSKERRGADERRG